MTCVQVSSQKRTAMVEKSRSESGDKKDRGGKGFSGWLEGMHAGRGGEEKRDLDTDGPREGTESKTFTETKRLRRKRKRRRNRQGAW